MTTIPYPTADLLFVDDLLTPVEAERLRDLRQLFQTKVRPIATDYWNRAEFPFELLPILAEQNLVGLGLRHGSHLLTGLVQMELTRRGIPFGITSGLRFFEQAHIKDVAAFLRFVTNRRDEVSFKRMAMLLPVSTIS